MDEANPNAAFYAREEERRTKLKAWLEAGAPRPQPAAVPQVEDTTAQMTQLDNDLAVCMATGVEPPATDKAAPAQPRHAAPVRS